MTRIGQTVKEMVMYQNTPLSMENINNELILQNLKKGDSICLCGYVMSWWIEPPWFELFIRIPEYEIIVECKYSLGASDNRELFDLLKTYNCLNFDETANLKGLGSDMSTDVYFKYSDVCDAYFVSSIARRENCEKFANEFSSKQLEQIMLNCYREQEKEYGKQISRKE